MEEYEVDMEFVEGDGVTYEVWRNKDNEYFRVPVEIKRYWDDKEQVKIS